MKKLQVCSNPLDFNDETKQVKEKNDRSSYLQEFNDYLNDQNCMSTVIIPHLDLVINMIEKNIFRPLPILKKQGLPGEGMSMEEVSFIFNTGISFGRSSMATSTTCVLVLFTAYC